MLCKLHRHKSAEMSGWKQDVVLVTKVPEGIDTCAISPSCGWGYTELTELLQAYRKDTIGHAQMVSSSPGTKV